MQRESQKDRTILCKYEPTEPGDYRIEVKWSGENVPGSPFVVMIFDTQEELSRFMQVRVWGAQETSGIKHDLLFQGGYSPHALTSDIYGSIGGGGGGGTIYGGVTSPGHASHYGVTGIVPFNGRDP